MRRSCGSSALIVPTGMGLFFMLNSRMKTPLQILKLVEVCGIWISRARRWLSDGQRDCKHTPVLTLLAREVEGCGRVWGG
jgi:hypothetical protein